MAEWSNLRLCDLANLSLGVLLFFSPWLFDLSSRAHWQTASAAGTIIAVFSVAALAAFAVWEEWLNLVTGLALIIAPWLLEFDDGRAVAIDVAIGIAVAALAAFAGWLALRSEARSQKRNRLRKLIACEPQTSNATARVIKVQFCGTRGYRSYTAGRTHLNKRADCQ